MAVLNFPANPSLNDEYSANGATWRWNGNAWVRLGDPGAQGAQGYQGVQGDVGAQGTQGAVGAQGDVGAQGAQGAQGADGAQGNQGFQGRQGDLGAQGAQGADGAQGDPGVQGAQGAQGADGAQGDAGAQGDPGVQGAQGADGAQGSQGYQGRQGTVGAQGAQGAQGYQGRQGTVGAQGTQGSPGSPGAQGAQGYQGRQGAQGQPAAGANGKILQVVQSIYNAQADFSLSAGAGFNATGLNATITPSSTSSKILIQWRQCGEFSSTATMYKSQMMLRRGSSTVLWPGTASGNRVYGFAPVSINYHSDVANTMENGWAQYIDSPSTTSAVTYYGGFGTGAAGTWRANSTWDKTSDNDDYARSVSIMILWEIGA